MKAYSTYGALIEGAIPHWNIGKDLDKLVTVQELVALTKSFGKLISVSPTRISTSPMSISTSATCMTASAIYILWFMKLISTAPEDREVEMSKLGWKTKAPSNLLSHTKAMTLTCTKFDDVVRQFDVVVNFAGFANCFG